MMDYIEKIKFPVINLDINDWNGEIINDVILEGNFYFGNKRHFDLYYLGHQVVDKEGRVFKIVDKENIQGWKSKIPFLRKDEIIFERIDKLLSINDLKLFYREKIDSIKATNDEHQNFLEKWKNDVLNVKTFEELFSLNL